MHSVEKPHSFEGRGGLSAEIQAILSKFDGVPSLKQLFWSVLSYDRAQDPLLLDSLPAHIPVCLHSLEVFASSEIMQVVYAVLRSPLDGSQIEQLAWTAQRELHTCVLLLHDRLDPEDAEGWRLVYPDDTKQPRIRLLAIPGEANRLRETSEALASLSIENEISGEAVDAFDLYKELNVSFPGVLSRLDQVVSDFADIANHTNPEVRDLLPFYRDVGRYPLLTAEQERGEDLHGNERPPDGYPLSYREWRLVMHNLRLVLWQARKVPRVGVTLSDLVQEGCFGLMTAAKRWDPERGFRFTTFALWWIRQAMYRGMHNNCNLIRWPVWRAVALVPRLLEGDENGLRAGEKPVKFLRIDWTRVSLYGCDAEAEYSKQETADGVRKALESLSDRERTVIERRFGLANGEDETLEAVGKDLQSKPITRERVRQIEAKALKKLKGFLSNELIPFEQALEWLLRGPQRHAITRRYKPYSEYMRGQRRMYSEDN